MMNVVIRILIINSGTIESRHGEKSRENFQHNRFVRFVMRGIVLSV